MRGENPRWIMRTSRSSYIRQCVLSFPCWIEFKDFKELHEEAKRRTKETGILHVLAHTVPLNHPLVCAPTVPWNLTIKTWMENAKEGNKFGGSQEQEQLRFSYD